MIDEPCGNGNNFYTFWNVIVIERGVVIIVISFQNFSFYFSIIIWNRYHSYIFICVRNILDLEIKRIINWLIFFFLIFFISLTIIIYTVYTYTKISEIFETEKPQSNCKFYSTRKFCIHVQQNNIRQRKKELKISFHLISVRCIS